MNIIWLLCCREDNTHTVLVDGRLQWSYLADVDDDVHLDSHAWLVASQLCQVHVRCSRYDEVSVTYWDLSTGQAGINDRHCMCSGSGQARPCRAAFTDARRWTCRLAGS